MSTDVPDLTRVGTLSVVRFTMSEKRRVSYFYQGKLR